MANLTGISRVLVENTITAEQKNKAASKKAPGRDFKHRSQ